MQKNILILAAHPDDEVLGCGGSIAKWANMGAQINVVYFTDGEASREMDLGLKEAAIKSRKLFSEKAAILLGIKSITHFSFPDNRMDQVSLLEVVKVVESLIEKFKPELICTHHVGDINVDHQALSKAVLVACRPQPGHCVKTILTFEIPSNTEWQFGGGNFIFNPNFFVDTTLTVASKIAAMKVYSAELREWPHPRSIKGIEYQSRLRGASIGVDAAEAFMVVRQVA